MPTKRVGIIGAGSSGLTAIKATLEAGLHPVCFERTDDLGGLWRYTEDVIEGKGSVARSTVIKTSKELTAFSDCPPPKDFPPFMHQEYVCEYFRYYADQFDLKKYITFNVEVESVTKADDFATFGKWKVKTKDRVTGKVTVDVFDFLMICTGHHCFKHYANFPGQENFKGEIIHTHDYRDGTNYVKKKVVVVGVGNSGCDAAAELSKICSPVFLSTRRGAWLQKNIGHKGLPGDMLAFTRYAKTIGSIFPWWFLDTIREHILNSDLDHVTYSLKPRHHVSSQHPSVNDELPFRIASGTVKVKPNIRKITKSSIEFDDGSVLEDVDIIIMATGYDYGFPYMDKTVVDIKDNIMDFYVYQWLPDIEKQTIAFIGCFQPTGPLMPIAELQCRWAMQIFSGEKKLPSSAEMWKDIKSRRETMRKRYVNTQRHTIQVDWIHFVEEIAGRVGCSPNIMKYLFTDPVLAYKLYFGPCTPYSYRLDGPHPWSGAREAIYSQWDRVTTSTMTRKVDSRDFSLIYMVTAVIVLLFAIALYIM